MSSRAEKTEAGTSTSAPAGPVRRPSPTSALKGSLVRSAEEHRQGNEEITSSDIGSKIAKSIPVDLVDPSPWQPRKVFDEKKIRELADEIDAIGLQNPIQVRPVNNRYQLVAGERRLRAHKLLELTYIQAFVVNITDEEASARALADNRGQEKLTEFEEYLSIKLHQEQFGETHGHERWGYSKSFFYRLMAFDSFAPAVKDLLISNPEVINAYAADEVKRLVSSEVEKGADRSKYDAALKTLIQQAIGNGKRLTNLANRLFAAVNANKSAPNKTELSFSGSRAAEIVVKASFTQLKLLHSAFNDEDVADINAYVAKKLREKETANA